MTTFTIITSSKNSLKDLKATHRSIKSLNYDNYEWIVVDSCSNDGTKNYLVNNNIIHIYEQDKSLYEAWNKAIIKSKGKWVIFLGAGDLLYKNTLRKYSEIIKNNSHINYIHGNVSIKNLNSLFAKKKIGRPICKNMLEKFMHFAHVGSAHKRCLFDNNLFNENYRIASDYEFFIKSYDRINSLYIDSVVAYMSFGGLSHGYKVLFECYDIQKKHFGILKAFWNLGLALNKRTIRKIVYAIT